MSETSDNKISIIVAVYNTEKYLKKCIESLINQTYRDIELIIVNDGSIDNSSSICEEYQKQDSRVIFLQKSNGGQGSARNLALKVATGNWIGFVDSNDWIDSDMYEFLLSKAISEKADIVECGWRKVTEDGTVEFKTSNKELSINRDKAMHALVYGTDNGINTSVCNKIFNRNCINNIRFPEVRAYEDDEFIHKVIWNSQNIYLTGVVKYNYLTRPNSTMTASFNSNKLALITVQENICTFLLANAPAYYNKALKTLCSKQLYIIAQILKNPSFNINNTVLEDLEKRLLKNTVNYFKNPEIGRNRLILLLFKISKPLAYKVLLQFYKEREL